MSPPAPHDSQASVPPGLSPRARPIGPPFLLSLLLVWVVAAGALVRGIAIGRGAQLPHRVSVGVNPNRAPWWELTILPEIGPSLARKIVAHRTAVLGRDGSAAQPFRTAADLDSVAGIGPKTVRRIAPFLCFDDR